jgi:hypothetical protein
VGGSGCRGEGGDREGGLTGGGGQWEAPVFEEGEAWPAGGPVSRRGRRSGCRAGDGEGLRRCSATSRSRRRRRLALKSGDRGKSATAALQS